MIVRIKTLVGWDPLNPSRLKVGTGSYRGTLTVLKFNFGLKVMGFGFKDFT
jgi:hypothetical protein